MDRFTSSLSRMFYGSSKMSYYDAFLVSSMVSDFRPAGYFLIPYKRPHAKRAVYTSPPIPSIAKFTTRETDWKHLHPSNVTKPCSGMHNHGSAWNQAPRMRKGCIACHLIQEDATNLPISSAYESQISYDVLLKLNYVPHIFKG